ncbi:hypothetical protein LRP88_02531 [Fusarium phalaenopsidis]
MAAVVNGVPVAIPPPEGYEVDFDNPQRNSVTAAYWLFGVGNFLALLFMLQRAYVRLVIQKTLRLEDACLGIAYVFSVVLQTLIIRDFARGIMGTHGWEMPITKFAMFVRALYLLPILYNPVQCGAKMALLLVYRRLAPQMWFRISVWFTTFVVIGSSLAITTVFTSIMRLIALINSMGDMDQSWGGGPVLLWIFAEANLSCICAALPTVKPFIKHISPRILGTTDPATKSGPAFSNPSAPPTIGAIGMGS